MRDVDADEDELQSIMEKTPQAVGRTQCPDCAGPSVSKDCTDWCDLINPGMPFMCICGIEQLGGQPHKVCERCDGTGWIESDDILFDQELMEEAIASSKHFAGYIVVRDNPGWKRLAEDVRNS